MIYLVISIFCTCLIYLIFKLIDKLNADISAAVVVNYITCSVVSVLFAAEPFGQYLQQAPNGLLPFSILLGTGYVTTFTLMGRATALLGVGGGTIVSRMSTVIPTFFAFFYLGEAVTGGKLTGVALALLSIYFTVVNGTPVEAKKLNIKNIWVPVLAFFGVGGVDVLLKLSQIWYVGNKTDTNFIALSYFAAGAGSIILLILNKNSGFKQIFRPKNMLLGLLLGIANYGGIYFFYEALTVPGMAGSTIFPINSVGIVTISTLLAIVFMGEKVNWRKVTGIALAIAAIILIGSS